MSPSVIINRRHSLPSSFSITSVFALSVTHERAGNRCMQFWRFAEGWTTSGETSFDGAHAPSQRCDVLADSRLTGAARRRRFGIEHHALLSQASWRSSALAAPTGTRGRFAVWIATRLCHGADGAAISPKQENARSQRSSVKLRHRPCGNVATVAPPA